MKATVSIDLQNFTPSEAQILLQSIFKNLKLSGVISAYHFEIDTPDGIVTENCILENEKVIA